MVARCWLRQDEIHCSPPQFLLERLFFRIWFLMFSIYYLHFHLNALFHLYHMYHITGWNYFSIVKRGCFRYHFSRVMINFVDSTSSSAIRRFSSKPTQCRHSETLKLHFLRSTISQLVSSMFTDAAILLWAGSCWRLFHTSFVLWFGVATRK